MVRITKNPEERKKEIIETAAKLFNERGYENTAISDIVKFISVAQGTFYYYFKSKEELVEPILEFIMNQSLGEVEEIINTDLPALEKLRAIIANRVKFVMDRERMVAFMWNKKNNFLFDKFKRYAIPRVIPIFTKLVEQGKREGVINVDNPNETIRIIILTALDIVDEIGFIKEKNVITDSEIKRKLKAYENILKRLLGVTEKIEFSLCDDIAAEIIKQKNAKKR